MIEFPTVAKEIRSLISRRSELSMFLGSVFAASGIVLRNTLGGNLPSQLAGIEEHIIRVYALMLMTPSLILSLRMARLHGGMVLNGMLHARLMCNQTFTAPGDVERAGRINYVGVSFLQFVLADFMAAFSVMLLTLTMSANLVTGLAAGSAAFVVWLAIYFHNHRRAAAFARQKIAAETFASVEQNDWEEHLADSLEDANKELLSLLGFVGLITFSVFEMISGLGEIKTKHAPELGVDQIQAFAPIAYTLLMLVTCVMGLITYLRIRVAIGRFSLDLDPGDQPFRTLTLTDSLLGYLLVAFFLAVAVHLLLLELFPGIDWELAVGIDLVVIALAVLAEQMTLAREGRKTRRLPEPEVKA